MTHRALLLGICGLLLLGSTPAPACLWDRDTLAIEAKQVPDVVNIITGRFERYPPLYYEMRRDRVLQEIAEDPRMLPLYDDLAVAYDRLGDSDSAIEWMAKKKAQLEILADREHLYRYYANLGTFHAHRWLSQGRNWEDMSDIDLACELIAKAIEINPDAHFGREKYQLMALEWIRDDPRDDMAQGEIATFLQDPREWAEGERLQGWPRKPGKVGQGEEAVEGISGLIRLGAAWESVDAHYALAIALMLNGHGHLSEFALLRVKELLEEGKGSLATDFEPTAYTAATRTLTLVDYYPKARAEAEQWAAEREAYILDRLHRGMHPDTDANFWRDYRESSQPPKYPFELSQGGELRMFIVGAILAILLLVWGVIKLQQKLRGPEDLRPTLASVR